MLNYRVTNAQLKALCNAYGNDGVNVWLVPQITLTCLEKRGLLRFSVLGQRYVLTDDGRDVMQMNSKRCLDTWFIR